MSGLTPSDFVPRFTPSECRDLIDAYKPSDDDEVAAVAASIRDAGYATHEQFSTLVRWKSHRVVHHLSKCTDEDVRDITSLALRSESERIRFLCLTLLPGVGWPVASVFLHWCHRDTYPILDFRAWWSLGRTARELDTMNFDDWLAYVGACRHWAEAYRLSARDLDRSLWAYSKKNQPSI